jgi:NCAIR mutase (PurE)-related protein
MFESIPKKTELMIVCDDKTMQYAKYLVQLVGRKDDSEDTTVGTKDGTVSAAIYTEKQYKDTLAKVTSNTHVLFIGKNKTTKEEAKFIDLKIDKYGLKYGWQGKRAVMFVDDSVKKDDYNAFIEYAKGYQLEYQKKNTDTKALAAAGATGVVAGAVAGWLIAPFVAAPATVYGLVKTVKAKEEIKEQQYRCLTLAMYMDGLQSFLEE